MRSRKVGLDYPRSTCYLRLMSARQVLTRSELGQNLRSRREQENLTQAELASLLGVSSRSVQEWEASRTFPRPAQRRAIAEFMKDAA